MKVAASLYIYLIIKYRVYETTVMNILSKNVFCNCMLYVAYVFQSESTLYSCLNVKELLAWKKRDIWSLGDSNAVQTHNHLVRKWTPYHLTKQTTKMVGRLFTN